MAALFNLIANENMKIYRRPRTWIMVGVLLVILAVVAALTNHFQVPPQADWHSSVQQDIKESEKTLADAENPLPERVRHQIEANIKVDQYYLEHDINPNAYTGWSFSKDSSQLIILITIFTAIVAGDIVASEFTWGTIKLLLIRPVSRSKIYVAKYIATLLFALLLLVFLFVWSYLIGGIVFGFDSLNMPYVYADVDGAVHQMSMVGYVLQTYGYQLVDLLMIVTISFMISASFRSSSFAIGLSLFVLFTGKVIVGELIGHFEWAKYILFANTDLQLYQLGQPLLPSMTLGFSVTVLVVYFLLFQAVAWWMFTKRDVAA
ncbi:MAG TPA: ABC transporter permease [Bacilli bacterium]|nr:ABC transporter permease [Bacilli bacterium]